METALEDNRGCRMAGLGALGVFMIEVGRLAS